MILQIIFLYGSFAFVDILDKFLLSKRKIQPLSYTFFTLITGAALLIAWPFVYQSLPQKFIWLNLLSGAFYGLAIYVYFKVLSFGEVSRVVPVVFGLVPVFDIAFSFFFGHHKLLPKEFAAMCLLVPGALIMAYYPGKKFYQHFGVKILAAFLISSYNWLWQYGAQVGGSLNNLMWNRLGAALAMLILLLIPILRHNIFKVTNVPKKEHTGGLFLLKQLVGGLNFVFLSFLLAKGKIPLVDGLAGFRYLFLFFIALLLSHNYSHVLKEEVDKHVFIQKIISMILIFAGTVILFI